MSYITDTKSLKYNQITVVLLNIRTFKILIRFLNSLTVFILFMLLHFSEKCNFLFALSNIISIFAKSKHR
nr:MAG TPA: hypothetical protein [Caudoviricetes sp.]